MYTSKPIKLHTKCLCILEMIQKCDSYLDNKKSDLKKYDNTKDAFAPIRLWNERYMFEKRIQTLESVMLRLTNYYNNTLKQLTSGNK